jgi:hypothetical protein
MSEPINVTIDYPDFFDSTLVTPLGEGRYRLELAGLNCLRAENLREARRLPEYGDVIEAIATAPDFLRFVRIVKRARMKKLSFLVSQTTIDSPQLSRVFARIEELGGHWERLFGGGVIVFLPRGTTYDPLADLNAG